MDTKHEKATSIEDLARKMERASEKQLHDAERRKPGQAAEEKTVNFLGVLPVSEELAGMLDIFLAWVKPHVRLGAERWIRENGPEHLAKFAGESRAVAAAELAANVVGWSTVLTEPALKAYHVLKDFQAGRHKLAQDMAPLLKAEGLKVAPASLTDKKLQGNEIVQVELAKLYEHAKHQWFQDVVTSAIAAIPQAIVKIQDDRMEKDGHGGRKTHETEDQYLKRRMAEVREEYKDDDEGRRIALARLKNETERSGRNGHNKHDGEFMRDAWRNLGSPLGSIVGNTIRLSDREKERASPLHETVYPRILKLRAAQVDQPELGRVDGKPLKEFLLHLFQDIHPKNRGREPLHDRWDEDLEWAMDKIAGALKDGMGADGVAELIGRNRIILKEERSLHSRAEIEDAIAETKKKFPFRRDVDPDKYLASSVYTVDEIKALEKTLKGETHDVFVTLFPRSVMLKAGYKEEMLTEAEKRADQAIKATAAKVFLDLGSMPPEKLRAAHYTDEEIKTIDRIAHDVQAKKEDALPEHLRHSDKMKDDMPHLLVGHKRYWQLIADGQLTPEQIYRQEVGEKLYPERQKAEEEARKEAEKKAEEAKKAADKEEKEEKKSGDEKAKSVDEDRKDDTKKEEKEKRTDNQHKDTGTEKSKSDASTNNNKPDKPDSLKKAGIGKSAASAARGDDEETEKERDTVKREKPTHHDVSHLHAEDRIHSKEHGRPVHG